MLPLSIFSINILSDHLLLLVSILVFIAVLISKVGSRYGMPTMLLFLLLGMLMGADGIGFKFEDYHKAEYIGHLAMTVILFSGGLQTSLKETRQVMKQSLVLSSLGVMLTSLFTAFFIWTAARGIVGDIGATFLGCFLLASTMSSTDSASVFAVLRDRKVHLRERLGPLLEMESGSNDPMAYVLTIMMVEILSKTSSGASSWTLVFTGALSLLFQLGIGLGVGVLMGIIVSWFLEKIELGSPAMYSVLILSIGFFINGVTFLLGGNGLLAAYVSAIVIGNRADMPRKREVLKFFSGMTWFMQLTMFLMLGLLVHPSRLPGVFLPAILVGVFIMLVARPLSVFLCLAPFRNFSFKAKAFVSWVGIKGGGPILFALCPVLAGLEGASDIFGIVFCVTLISLLLQGTTLVPLGKYLDISYDEDPSIETFGLELPEEMGMLRDHIVGEADLAEGSTLRDMHLPHGIRVVMVRRAGKFLVPHGSMELFPGDRLIIVIGDSDD